MVCGLSNKRRTNIGSVSISTRKKTGTDGQGPKWLPGLVTKTNWIYFIGVGQRNDLVSKIISRWSPCWVDHEAWELAVHGFVFISISVFFTCLQLPLPLESNSHLPLRSFYLFSAGAQNGFKEMYAQTLWMGGKKKHILVLKASGINYSGTVNKLTSLLSITVVKAKLHRESKLFFQWINPS